MQQTKLIMLLTVIFFFFLSCKKEFLNTNPGSRYNVPSSVEELQAIYDKEIVIAMPTLGELSSDAYYLKETFWETLVGKEKNAYIWAEDIFGSAGNDDDWDQPYKVVYYANTILDNIENIQINSGEEKQLNAIKGAALFIRSFSFFNLAQVFAVPYDSKSAPSDLGIPLRLTSHINEVTTRATVKETYERILSDLLLARHLINPAVDSNRNRPSLPAVWALLSRVYLSMNMYHEALLYADSSLQLYDTLMDYNILNEASPFPFSRLNSETLFQSRLNSKTKVLIGIAAQGCIVDSFLYRSYAQNDLRRTLFYANNTNGFPATKGSYYESVLPFNGLATDELFLIRAECNARFDNTTDALEDLNKLLFNRYRTGTFVPVQAQSSAEALEIILTERQKELAFRGLRWTDIRRLNKSGSNITLTRKLNGSIYTLQPNDKRYALPIPPEIILRTGILQNSR